MSVEAISWALNQAPVDEPSATLVLVALANHAGPDGRGAFPSVARLVSYTRLSERTIREQLDILENARIITPCDPAIIAAYIKRGDQRPQGWDLNLALDRDNPAHLARFRAAVQAVKDKRKKRRERLQERRRHETEPFAKSQVEAPQPNGVRPSHPVDGTGSEGGTGCDRRRNGVRPSPERGATVAPEPSYKPSLNPPYPPTPHTEPAPGATPPHGGGGGGNLNKENPDSQAQALVAELSATWGISRTHARERAIPAVIAALNAGWTVDQIRNEVTRPRPGDDDLRSPGAAMTARLENLPEFPPAPPQPDAAPVMPPRCSDPRHDPYSPYSRWLEDPETGKTFRCRACHPELLVGGGVR